MRNSADLNLWSDQTKFLRQLGDLGLRIKNSISMRIPVDWNAPPSDCLAGTVPDQTLGGLKAKRPGLRICQELADISCINPASASNMIVNPLGNRHRAAYLYFGRELPESFRMGLDTFAHGTNDAERVALIDTEQAKLASKHFPDDFYALPYFHEDCALVRAALELRALIQSHLEFADLPNDSGNDPD